MNFAVRGDTGRWSSLFGAVQGGAVCGESFPEPDGIRPDRVDIGPQDQE
jgi:hypothetical protein